MRKFGFILSIVSLLLAVGITESFSYTLKEAAATERCDDLRESEEFHVSNNSIKVSKTVFVVLRKESNSHATKNITSYYAPAPSLFQFLYLRLRVLRN